MALNVDVLGMAAQTSLFALKKTQTHAEVKGATPVKQEEVRSEYKKQIRLSPSTISVFRECPRCFWLALNKNIYRPRGIFPSLPGGMDLVIKTYFDGYRVRGEMPPEVKGKVRGRLYENLERLEAWRNWRLGLRYEDRTSGGVLSGALDDCLIKSQKVNHHFSGET